MKKKLKKRRIYITNGIGEGKTKISAFDKALAQAGVANYNLIYLSSVIPENSIVELKKMKSKESEYGKRCYVVIARSDQNIPKKEAWAGLSWTQDKDGKGLFAEHHSDSKKKLLSLIRNTLPEMKTRRNYKYGKINSSIVGITCKEKAVCAVSIAFFKSENWN